MTSPEHKKHAAINRPNYGNFGRAEWAIVGTNCGAIKGLAGQIIAALSPKVKCAYVDAQHAHGEEQAHLPGRLASGAVAEYTDQITHHQFTLNRPLNQFQFRQWFSEMDLVLVNGNHQQAKAQVVVIDPAKEASLQKRLSQLTHVQLFLLTEGAEEIFPFLKEVLPAWQEIPVYRLQETEKIVSFFQNQLRQAAPVLNGLVLAGGRSVRMGQDKGALQWHGKEQRYHLAEMMQEFCAEVFISCRAEQQPELAAQYPTLPDTFLDLGPYGAILSAFREQPEAAWLVVACDLPLVDQRTLWQLVQERNPSAVATAFENPQNRFPEPLITIWEPKSYLQLLAFLAQGYTCPRKVLINSATHLLQPGQPEALLNVNTPQEQERARQLLAQR
ncbi:NTP transferase domain-containing protein [Rufibacter ruber]|uniref:NTP transferase domain-containing protein n=1 Tax=Rufibacter ruber TaxID=1783499 RepID=UPI000A8219F4|nr:NTP transferase domain-containing protein [Rufibacter ruber]